MPHVSKCSSVHGGSGKRYILGLCLLLGFAAYRAFAQAPIPQDNFLVDAPSQQLLGIITGIVTDPDGAALPAATATLTGGSPSHTIRLTAFSDTDGRFSFPNIPVGPFKLILSSPGFLPVQSTGELHPGEHCEIPQIVLPTVSTSIQVQVTASQEEIAEAQIKAEEKQRVLGVIPNFFVSYVPHPAPLNSRQKFELAWKSVVDPTAFAAAGFAAGIQQAANNYPDYGEGARGYSQRFGSSYGNIVIGTMIGSAILPSVLKQDPRYFYKGTGTINSRILYALANAVVCKGDNGHWQFNFSGIGGTAAAAGISNLYYPAADRQGASLTAENSLIGIGGSVVTNLFQEFLVRKLTRHIPPPQPSEDGTQSRK